MKEINEMTYDEQAYCPDESIVKKAPTFAGYQLTRPRTEKLSTN